MKTTARNILQAAVARMTERQRSQGQEPLVFVEVPVVTRYLLTPPLIKIFDRLPPQQPNWRAIVDQADIDRANRLGPDKCATVPDYLPDGRRILDVLEMMPEGRKKDAFYRKHGVGMVNVCYLPGGSLEGTLTRL